MNSVNQRIGLRKRVILPLIVVGASILLAGGYLVYQFESKNLHNAVKHQADSMQQHFQTMLDAKAKTMAADLWFIARKPEILHALRARERHALLALSTKLYDYLNVEHNITHLYFHDAQRINLLRVHKPQRNGDKIERYTTLQAEERKTLYSGLELGPLGTFTLRAVLPVIENNELLGYIELGQEIDELIHHARNIFGFEIYVLIDKAFLIRNTWEIGMKMLDRPSNWNQLSTAVLVSQSLPDLHQSDLEKIASWRSEERDFLQEGVVLKNSHYFVEAIPIQDAKGEKVAKLVILQDISESEAEVNEVLLIVLSLSLLIGLIILYFFYDLLGRTETALANARQQIFDEGKAKQEMQAKFIEQLQYEHEKLRTSEERFEKISASAQDAIISIDNKGDISFWNKAAEKIFGYLQEEVLGKNLHSLIMPQRYHDAFQNAFSIFQQSGQGEVIDKTNELFGLRKDGSEFPVELSLSSAIVEGKWTGIGILRDITERKKAQLEIERALHIQRVLDTILNISLPAVTLKDVLFRALDAILSIPSFSLLNQGSVFLVSGNGQALEMVAQRNLPDSLLHSCSMLPFGKCLCGKAAASQEIIFSSSLDGRHEIHYDGMEPHGHYCIPIMNENILLGVLNIYTPAEHSCDQDERDYLKTVADTLAVVIERKKDEEALIQLAHHDVLTGLPNRSLFYDRLEQILMRAQRHQEKFVVFFIDLDHFKKINDTLGHKAGDYVLLEVATRIQACVKRKTDTIARMGGDEFTIILPDVGKLQNAKIIAENIIHSISLPIELDEGSYQLGCSIGIAQYPDHGEDCETLISHADDAMYMAKKQRNTYCLYSLLNEA